jgi:hypothetical protein
MSIYSKVFSATQLFTRIEKSATNPHFKKAYSDLGDILASIEPGLRAYKLLILHSLEGDKLVTSIVDVESSESITSSFPIPSNIDPQKTGAAISYGKRYNLSCLLNLQSEKDDDGNSVSRIDLKDKAHARIVGEAVKKYNFSDVEKQQLVPLISGLIFGDLDKVVADFAESLKGEKV